MLKTIGHHVCENQGNGAEIERKGYPIALSKARQKIDSQGNEYTEYPFLGKGYYFWDYNIAEATNWGKKHYEGRYYIFEAEINCSDTVMLDLVGNRRHMEGFLKLWAKICKENDGADKWELGKLFDYILEIVEEENIQHIFPYKIIRALDYQPTENQNPLYFDPKSNRYTFLDPRIIISVTECSPNTITNFKLIKSER